jgi:hypothetical protein
VKVEEAYENIERIVTFGFLSVRISYKGHDLLIKNISDKEYHQMQMFCSSGDRLKLNLFSLAYSTVSIDGVNLLENRNDSIQEIIGFYKRSSSLFVLKIIEAINELNDTYVDSLDFLEGYSYSTRSRYLWTVLDPYSRSMFTGIRGLDVIGVNSVVESWININKRLDEEHEYDRALNNTLLVVGASNYKSAKMLSKNYEKHTQELKELRDDICKYGYDRKRVEENEKKREEWTAPLSSREDLVRELYRQMSGDKDRHDMYIDQWIANQKGKADEAQRNVEERQNAFRKKVEGTDLDLLEPSKPISSSELNKMLYQKKNHVKPENAYMAGNEKSEIRDRVYKKLSTKIIRPEMKEAING